MYNDIAAVGQSIRIQADYARLSPTSISPNGSGVTFDAPRIEVDTAVAGGPKKKRFAHADAFWAKALCDLAADGPALELGSTVPADEPANVNARGFV